MSEPRLQRWVAAIPGSSPVGVDARYEPGHERVRAEIAKLEDPAAGAVAWAQVVAGGGELLQGQSKDLLIACYLAGGLLETEGLSGLGTGLQLVAELIERYWEPMFPPLRRMRARSGAVQWLLDRAQHVLSGMASAPADDLEAVRAALQALREACGERLSDAPVAFQPAQDALSRVTATGPAPAAPPSVPTSSADATQGASPAAPVPAATSAARPTAVAEPAATTSATATSAGGGPSTTASGRAPTEGVPVAAPTVPVGEGALDAAAAPSSAPVPPGADASVTPSDAPSPSKDEPVSLQQRLATLAEPWLQPIPGADPTGQDLRYEDAAHAFLREEIKQMDMPNGRPPDWPRVVREGGELLRERSKDLLIAVYVAEGLARTGGMSSLLEGIALVRGLLDGFHEGLFPTRDRARGSALGWWFERFEARELPTLEASERGDAELLEAAVELLSEVVMARIDAGSRPALGPMRTWVARLAASVPADEPPPKPAPASAPKPAPAAAPKPPAASPGATAPAATTAPAEPLAKVETVGAGASPQALTAAQVQARTALFGIAHAARAADPTAPIAYKLARDAAYLRLTGLPKVGDNGRTGASFQVGDGALRKMLDNGHHEKLVNLCERSLERGPLLLDLHYYCHQALKAQGDSHEKAAETVYGLAVGLVAAHPTWVDLIGADGRPFANPDCRRWLQERLGEGSGAASSSGDGGAAQGADPTRRPEVQKAAAQIRGDAPKDGLAAFQRCIDGAASGRERFLLRLHLAELLVGQRPKVAAGLYGTLSEEIEARDLGTWDADLAARCLSGYHACLTGLANKDPEMARIAGVVYRRLCRVDPARALGD